MTSSPDDFPPDGRCFEPTDEFEYHHSDDLPALNTLNRPTPPIRDNSASAIGQSQYNVLQRSFTSDTDNENCSFQPYQNPVTRPMHSSAEEISAIAPDMTIPDPNNCFDYEAAFESQIESAKVTRVYGSRDLLDEYGSRDTLFDDVSSSHGVKSRRRKPFLILRYSRRFEEQESTEETDDTLKGRRLCLFLYFVSQQKENTDPWNNRAKEDVGMGRRENAPLCPFALIHTVLERFNLLIVKKLALMFNWHLELVLRSHFYFPQRIIFKAKVVAKYKFFQIGVVKKYRRRQVRSIVWLVC